MFSNRVISKFWNIFFASPYANAIYFLILNFFCHQKEKANDNIVRMNSTLKPLEDDYIYKSITENILQQSFNLNVTSELITHRHKYNLFFLTFILHCISLSHALYLLQRVWASRIYSINNDITLFTLKIEPLGISMAWDAISCAIPINKYFVVVIERCVWVCARACKSSDQHFKDIICQYFCRWRKWYKRSRTQKKKLFKLPLFYVQLFMGNNIANRKERKEKNRKDIAKHAHFVFMLYLFPWHVVRILISSDVYALHT